MNSKPICSCMSQSARPLIFACSGASDVGEITDRAAHRLSRDKTARMYCTSAIAARIEEYLSGTRDASRILLLDGCEHHCARKVMEQAEFREFDHVCLSDYGFIKGQSPATGENIERAADICRTKLGSCC